MTELHRRQLLTSSLKALLSVSLTSAGLPALADTGANAASIDLHQIQLERGDDGLQLSYRVVFDLPKDIEDALYKGVAVVFVAETTLLKRRWYWSDKQRSRATRRWRLAYQPLTRRWRLTQDGLARQYNSLEDALFMICRVNEWRIGENVPAGDERDYYVDFSFRLDTDELPRPMQIGLGIQSDWNIAVQRQINVSIAR
ncbi:DUF4390 domain-containing protein [Aquabacterium sp.]|uniref:DUF4390 domain-containing protein n=1 Tax=Aquabacterium sp. TaxID=1872578 RepID=UPI0035B4D1AC